MQFVLVSAAVLEARALLGGANVTRADAQRALTLLTPYRPPPTHTSFTSGEYTVLFECGRAELLAERYQLSVNTYTQLLCATPKDVGALSNRGIAFHRGGNRDAALADYNAALQIDPTHELTRAQRAQLLQQLDLHRAALQNATDGVLLCTDSTKTAAARERATQADAALKGSLAAISSEAAEEAVRDAADTAEEHAAKQQKVVDTRFDRLTARVNELHAAQRQQLQQQLDALQRSVKEHTATAAAAVATKVDALAVRVAKQSAAAAAGEAADPGPLWRGKPMSTWTVGDVSEWLRSIGSSAYLTYAQEFTANALNGAAVLELSDELLPGLGVTNPYHRARLMGDIKRARAAFSAVAAGGGPETATGADAPASAAASSSSSLNDMLAEQQRALRAEAAATKELDRLRQCIVCVSADRNVRFSPCGHMCCCGECGGKALTRCPLCRMAIKSRQTTYLA